MSGEMSNYHTLVLTAKPEYEGNGKHSELASLGHTITEIFLCSFGKSLETSAALRYIEIDS